MQLAIVGVGKLGLSILKGVVSGNHIAPQDIGLLEQNTERAEQISAETGARLIRKKDLRDAERVVVSVQPRTFPEIAPWLSQADTGYISTMAGVNVATLASRLGTQRVVRVMPHLGATIGRSQTAITAPQEAHDAGDLEFARTLFQAVGDVYDLPEHLFNAFTGLSGSGPAYIAVVAEALADGGVRMGLPRALANELATKLLISSGELLKERSHCAVLKDEVASPGGTTIAGIEALERAGVRGGLMSAVMAATKRGDELGKGE